MVVVVGDKGTHSTKIYGQEIGTVEFVKYRRNMDAEIGKTIRL